MKKHKPIVDLPGKYDWLTVDLTAGRYTLGELKRIAKAAKKAFKKHHKTMEDGEK